MKLVKLHSGKKLDLYSANVQTELELPLLPFSLSAGFPSPALDFVDISIDLNKHLIEHPSATYYGRVQGESMKDAGINDGDLVIIDRSVEPIDGKIAVCFLDGEFTLKRICYKGIELWLMPENNKYKPIKVEEDNQLLIWGVVTYVIKKTL
ncbi:MAG: translesion error-prone DNA polymerase V autoproteolytic subunit [Flavobacteriia bacterium]|nr:translesion error-prone DNA polymerase V autoproteolytic subunit [Flavobacteriia bacterium]